MLVASDTSDIAHTTSRLGVLVALTGAGVVLVAALAAAALTRRGLRPLRTLAAAAGEIEATADPTRRLPEATLDEIEALTGVLNRMLASLEEARESERRLLADASHELRTPVTALLGNVEYAARHGADAEVMAELRHDALRLARLVDSLLALERAGEGGASSSRAARPPRAFVVNEHDPGRVHLGAVDAVTVDGDKDGAAPRAGQPHRERAASTGRAPAASRCRLDVDGDVARLSVVDEGDGSRSRRARSACSSASGAGREPPSGPGPGWGCRSWRRSPSATAGACWSNGPTFTIESCRLQPEPAGAAHGQAAAEGDRSRRAARRRGGAGSSATSRRCASART